MNLATILSKLGISTGFTQDVTLLIVVVLASFLLGIFIGRSRLIAVLINSYISFSVVSVIPANYLADYTYRLLIFLILLIALTLWGRKLFDVSLGGIGSGFMWKIFTLSFLEVALILSTLVSFMPKKDALVYISPSSYGYLTNGPMPLIWMAAPLIFLLFMQRRSR